MTSKSKKSGISNKPDDNSNVLYRTISLGIAIPAGTDQDGVSFLKAALLCTAEDSIVAHKRLVDNGEMPDDLSGLHRGVIDTGNCEFVVNTPTTKSDVDYDKNVTYPNYAMLQCSIAVKIEVPEDYKPPSVLDIVEEDDDVDDEDGRGFIDNDGIVDTGE